MKPRKASYLRVAAIEGLIILLAAAGGEISIRAFRPEFESLYHSKSVTGGHPVVLNSRGLRDLERPPEKPIGVKRIALIGDSIAWGYSVAQEQVVGRVVERLLNENRPGRYEVINYSRMGQGLNAYVPDPGELLADEPGVYLERISAILADKPDAVLYLMCLNDVADAYTRPDKIRQLQRAKPEASPPSLKQALLRLRVALRRSALFSWLDTRLTLWMYRRGMLKVDAQLPQFEGLFAAFGSTPWAEEGWRLLLRDIVTLDRTAMRAGIPLVIAQFPYRFQLQGPRENPWGVDTRGFHIDPFQRVARLCRARKIPWVNLLDAYNVELGRQRSAREGYRSLMGTLDFVHPNALGHQVAGAAIYRKLLEMAPRW